MMNMMMTMRMYTCQGLRHTYWQRGNKLCSLDPDLLGPAEMIRLVIMVVITVIMVIIVVVMVIKVIMFVIMVITVIVLVIMIIDDD